MTKSFMLKAFIATTFSTNVYAQSAIAPLTPTPELKRYETQLFNLLDRSEKKLFDPDVSRAYESLLQKAPVTDPNLQKKLLTGPAPKGRYVSLDGTHYFYYTACQAHWCSATNIAMLFNPNTKSAVGMLNYKCTTYYLNLSHDSQKRWFEALDPRLVTAEAQKKICEEAKASKP